MAVSISAANAKKQSTTWSRTVIEEVSIIDVHVAAAIQDGSVSATIGATTSVAMSNTSVVGSSMTADNVTGQSYYNVWQNLLVDPAKDSDMSAVIKHFTDLGYSISRRANSAGTLFSWYITWA